MSRLLELQCAMREALCSQEPETPGCIVGSDAADRLDLHRQTLRNTLRKALALTYPAVRRLVGEDFFDGVAVAFTDGNPPVKADLNRYGRGFPDFLAKLPACAELRYLSDVARLDAAVAKALHAPDAEPLDAGALQEAIANAEAISFVPHPAATVLASHFPVHGIWKAVLAQDDATLAAIDLDSGTEHLLVHRTHDRVEVLPLQAGHWHFTNILFSGGQLSEAIVESQAAEGAAGTWLADHLLAGRIVGVRTSKEIT